MRATGALSGWAPWLAAGVVFAGVVLVAAGSDPMRRAAFAAALALLALAPAAWGVQTLGHATNGVFPAGGPAAMAGGPGGGGPMVRGGGGMFGGGSGSLSDALAYIEANGGGTLAVSSQSTAATAVLETGADVAALGGFSGRESEVDAAWLAEAVASGRIRWVRAEQSGGMPNDGRTGSRAVMAAVEATCAATSVDGLYDCAGAADALASAG